MSLGAIQRLIEPRYRIAGATGAIPFSVKLQSETFNHVSNLRYNSMCVIMEFVPRTRKIEK